MSELGSNITKKVTKLFQIWKVSLLRQDIAVSKDRYSSVYYNFHAIMIDELYERMKGKLFIYLSIYVTDLHIEHQVINLPGPF